MGLSPIEAAIASANAVSALTSRFMLDGPTYVRGGELGFQGMDFYTAGRGGVLGDVDADVVQAAFVFFSPTTVRTSWDASRTVAPRDVAATEFAACAHRWAVAHLPETFDAARLAELAGRIAAAADPALAPVFAGWRALAEPEVIEGDARALAVHRMNSIRELRNARHAVAVVAAGIDPADAVVHRSPQMAPLFGWVDITLDADDVASRWADAETATDVLLAPALAALDENERAEFVALANEAEALSR